MLQDVLADPGYSAERDKAWLRELLTAIELGSWPISHDGRERIRLTLKKAIAEQQNGRPISDDVL